MTLNSKILAIIEDTPPPLDPLTNEVISPANIAAEARRLRAQTLTFSQKRKIRAAIKPLDKQLKASGINHINHEYETLRPRLETLHERYAELKAALTDAPQDEKLQADLKALRAEINPVWEQWKLLKSQRADLLPTLNERNQLRQRLEDDKIARERIRTEKKLMLAIVKEAKIYERIIIDKWSRLGFSYRRTEGNKQKVDKVSFSEVGITLDAIYYKIDASYRTAFGNWQTNVPQGIYISTQLLAEDTLTELGITCQRQVTGIYNNNGAWVIVHRLDSIDGLMNYVRWEDVMERYPEKYHARFPICVGVGQARKVQWINLSDYPHWLVAGFTNSGKSNMVNVGISSLITKHSPEEIRLVLIDLKGGLEFDFYKGIPHLHGDTVDNIEGVANALAQLEAIMRSRFRRFKGVAKNIEEYHLRRPQDYMPRVLCVFDEVASVMSQGDLTKQISASLRELTRMGRAVGIHIWLCTQRPDVNAIDGQVKNNLALRLSGRMASNTDSITVIGSGAAKELAPIQGRMVLQIGPDPIFIQTPHISNEALDSAIDRAKGYPTPPPLDVPDFKQVIHQVWTTERVIEMSIKHLGGKITWKDVYQAADDLSQAQSRALVERIWNTECIEFDGKKYRVQKGRSNVRRLVEIPPEAP